VVQVVEHLPSKGEALIQTPVPPPKKKKKKRRRGRRRRRRKKQRENYKSMELKVQILQCESQVLYSMSSKKFM
jgi:hypothetical protein